MPKFVKKAIAEHGDRYDYSLVNYTMSRNKVTIICPDHGEFHQIASNHLRGCGCPQCGNIKKRRPTLTTAEFVERARVVHGVRYDYSLVEYINSYTKVVIICKIHGSFEQLPNNHLSGNNCARCYNDR